MVHGAWCMVHSALWEDLCELMPSVQSYKAGHSTWKTRLSSIDCEPAISPHLHIYDISTQVDNASTPSTTSTNFTSFTSFTTTNRRG